MCVSVARNAQHGHLHIWHTRGLGQFCLLRLEKVASPPCEITTWDRASAVEPQQLRDKESVVVCA